MNEYCPWQELNMSELEYMKMRYLEARADLKLAVAALKYYAEGNGVDPEDCSVIERPLDSFDFPGLKARQALEEIQ